METVKVEPAVVVSPEMMLELPVGIDCPAAELIILQLIVVLPEPETTWKVIPPTDRLVPLGTVQAEDRVSWNWGIAVSSEFRGTNGEKTEFATRGSRV